MDGRKLKCFSLGGFETNSYVVYDSGTLQAVIIDAPAGIETVVEFVKSESLKVAGVLLTHGHIDHIQGLKELDFPFYIHPEDAIFLSRPQLNLSSLTGDNFSLSRHPFLFTGRDCSVGGFKFKIVHLPGHTPGSVGIIIKDWLFSGDTLFCGSIGRTDLPGSSEEDMEESLRKIVSFDDKMLVFPGHGPSTNIGREKKSNPFLQRILHRGTI